MALTQLASFLVLSVVAGVVTEFARGPRHKRALLSGVAGTGVFLFVGRWVDGYWDAFWPVALITGSLTMSFSAYGISFLVGALRTRLRTTRGNVKQNRQKASGLDS
ncbi:hypothetical protein ASA1KI_43550 [Opitutales bacterium ASA1]|nr:hypothetical protein ASA1KI_43550 [Opitutales bacterium ASA1]